MAINFKLGTKIVTSAESPFVLGKEDFQSLSFYATAGTVATFSGDKLVNGLVSDPLPLIPLQPITLSQGLGIEDVEIIVTSGEVHLMLV
jgi:hypothetical protein